MSNEIELYEEKALAFNGRKAKSTDDDIVRALSPIFVAHPHLDVTDEWLRLHKLMLRDIAPDALARAVLDALATNEYPPTIAAIRKAASNEDRAPGPRSDVDPRQLKPVPTQMFRLDEEEDRRQRMERLRMTQGWGKYYA